MKEIIVRVIITFFEAMIGAIIATASVGINLENKSAVIYAIAGAIGAGISAVWNTVLIPLIERIKAKYKIK